MTILEYDNSFEGLLTAVFEVYEHHIDVVSVCKTNGASLQLFGVSRVVTTDTAKAARVLKKITSLLGQEGTQMLWQAWLSELPEIDNAILGVVRYAILEDKDVLTDYAHPDVLKLRQTARMVHREKHRMEAFVRFQLTADGLYYAVIEPDFNVLPLILPHFETRYADQRWLIYDSKRQYGIFYDLEQTTYVSIDAAPDVDLSAPAEDVMDASEAFYQTLWRDYFRSTNIPSRKNMQLHLRHVPRRYWHYLTEKRISDL
jgi:probable DNA metabolism protein